MDSANQPIVVWENSSSRLMEAFIGLEQAGTPVPLFDTESAPKKTFCFAKDPTGAAIVVSPVLINGKMMITASHLCKGKWSAPEMLSTPGIDNYFAHLQMSAAGDAAAVWNRGDGGERVEAKYWHVQGRIYTGGVWGDVQDISADCGSTHSPRVAIASGDNALAIWAFPSETVCFLKGSHYSDGSWSTPMVLSFPDQSADQPQLCQNAAGKGVAVWCSLTGRSWNIAAAQWEEEEGWSLPEILSDIGRNDQDPSLDLNQQGEAVVAWRRRQAAHQEIQAALLIDGEWSEPLKLYSNPRFDADPPCAKINEQGNAVVAWPCGKQLFACTYKKGVWSDPQRIAICPHGCSSPDVSINNDDQAIVVWEETVGEGTKVVRASTANL